MNQQHERLIIDCKLGIKTFQNINAAALGFEKIISIKEQQDAIVFPSVFYWSVIRYAKPFLNSKIEEKTIKYPVKQIKNTTGFSSKIHEHLINVRNTLIAHDDFDDIPPRILKMGMTLNEQDFFIPTSVTVTNKSISFPNRIETIEIFLNHTIAARDAVHQKLIDDMTKIRELTLNNQDIYKEHNGYEANYGSAEPDQNNMYVLPQFQNDAWLQNPTPSYQDLHDGYLYEEARIQKNFLGPEVITLPDGSFFELNPSIIAK